MNDWIALRVTNAVGTMWCAYLFAGLALISLPVAIQGGTGPLVAWIAQTFCQLVLLPLIIVGQRLQGANAEARSQLDHEALMEELVILREMHGEVHLALGIEIKTS